MEKREKGSPANYGAATRRRSRWPCSGIGRGRRSDRRRSASGRKTTRHETEEDNSL